MAQPPPSGTGQQDKSYFKNSVAKDGKATAFAKAVVSKAKEGVADSVQAIKMQQQYESELMLDLPACSALPPLPLAAPTHPPTIRTPAVRAPISYWGAQRDMTGACSPENGVGGDLGQPVPVQ
eukprot:SAG25_NODE_133_length_14402_cov_15.122142_6_plen_123_part_00